MVVEASKFTEISIKFIKSINFSYFFMIFFIHHFLQQTSNGTSHDDVLGVVSHLDHMVTLLLLELHNCNKTPPPASQAVPPAPCLEFLLSENLLDKLYEWSKTTERYIRTNHIKTTLFSTEEFEFFQKL